MKSMLTWALLGLASTAVFAQPRIAVTDLAYTQAVSEYFEAATMKESSNLNANRNAMSASYQGSATYVAGTYSYICLVHPEMHGTITVS